MQLASFLRLSPEKLPTGPAMGEASREAVDWELSETELFGCEKEKKKKRHVSKLRGCITGLTRGRLMSLYLCDYI